MDADADGIRTIASFHQDRRTSPAPRALQKKKKTKKKKK